MNLSRHAPPAPYVLVIDDDPGMLKSTEFLLQTEKIQCQTFSSGSLFLENIVARPALLSGPGCILLDVRMPGLNGVEVFDRLIEMDPQRVMPVIFVTAHGDLALVTQVLKKGAVDFVTKPFDGEDLIGRLNECFAISSERYIDALNKQEVLQKISELTGRELMVMGHLYEGLSNKDIADLLGNSVRTVELRRATIYDKLNIHSVVDLAKLLSSVKWTPPVAVESEPPVEKKTEPKN